MKRALISLLLLSVACASSGGPDARGAMTQFMADLNALNYDAIVGHFAEDATAFFPVVRAERADGKEVIAKIFRDYVAGNTKKTNIVPEDLQAQAFGDVAVITFNVHNPSAISRRTFVWRRDAHGWRIVHMHASNVAKPSPSSALRAPSPRTRGEGLCRPSPAKWERVARSAG